MPDNRKKRYCIDKKTMGCLKINHDYNTEPIFFGVVNNLCPQKSKKYVRSTLVFGFNGGEKINEITGHVDLGERGVDTRLGRLNWSTDPKTSSYPFLSPYAFAANNPITLIDRNGEDPYDPRTNSIYVISPFSAAVWNIPQTKTPDRDEVLYRMADDKAIRYLAGSTNEFGSWGDPVWPSMPITMYNSAKTNELIEKRLGKANHRSAIANQNSLDDFKDAAKNGTYSFINQSTAQKIAGIKYSAYEIISVKNNQVTGITSMEWSDGAYRLTSTTDITTKAGETYEKKVFFGLLTEKYQKITVTENITNYDADGNATSTEVKTYEQEKKL